MADDGGVYDGRVVSQARMSGMLFVSWGSATAFAPASAVRRGALVIMTADFFHALPNTENPVLRRLECAECTCGTVGPKFSVGGAFAIASLRTARTCASPLERSDHHASSCPRRLHRYAPAPSPLLPALRCVLEIRPSLWSRSRRICDDAQSFPESCRKPTKCMYGGASISLSARMRRGPRSPLLVMSQVRLCLASMTHKCIVTSVGQRTLGILPYFLYDPSLGEEHAEAAACWNGVALVRGGPSPGLLQSRLWRRCRTAR
ncbi:hypothetical protein DFH06DRAFT_734205 [Mycena polygramma]|nr:hypothetical protein DFH06DRAFT_734205 [Mycena polygramma]